MFFGYDVARFRKQRSLATKVAGMASSLHAK